MLIGSEFQPSGATTVTTLNARLAVLEQTATEHQFTMATESSLDTATVRRSTAGQMSTKPCM